MANVTPIKANWPYRRFTGKLWSVARLLKAAFTFTGGADYIAWKIERHSGQKDRADRLAAPPSDPRGSEATANALETRRCAVTYPLAAFFPCPAATTSPNSPIIRSISASLCAADTEQRSRHSLLGVPGGSAMLT